MEDSEDTLHYLSLVSGEGKDEIDRAALAFDIDLEVDIEEAAQLEEFFGHLVNGISAPDAVALVWGLRTPDIILSEIISKDGKCTVVGWDTCVCAKHISVCKCPTGPSRPGYITKMSTTVLTLVES